MRVLTVRQPWAWAIIHGGKDVENRTRNIAGAYRGPVAIHVAKSIDEHYEDSPQARLMFNAVGTIRRAGGKGEVAGLRQVPQRIEHPDERDYHVTERYGYRGAIIGVVDLIAVMRPGQVGHPASKSDWAMGGHHHLVLANPRPLSKPIPYKGALGLRKPPDDVIAEIGKRLSK